MVLTHNEGQDSLELRASRAWSWFFIKVTMKKKKERKWAETDAEAGWGNSGTRLGPSWAFLTSLERWKALADEVHRRQNSYLSFIDWWLLRFPKDPLITWWHYSRLVWARDFKAGGGHGGHWCARQTVLFPPSLSSWVWSLTKHRGLVFSSSPSQPAEY